MAPPVWQFLLWACLAWILLLARLWPTQPLFPGDGLDYSWQFAMDFATAHKLAIGRDVVFTYGPYADLASRLYDPATRSLNMAAMALLTASLAVALAALARPVALLCTVAMLPLAYTNDAFAFVLPLPALLLCAKAIQGPPPRHLTLAMMLLAPAIALLPLIKLSYLPVTLIGAVGAGGLLWMAEKRRLAAGTVALVCLSVPALWCASGQAIGNITPYFKNGSAIIAGYAGAMVTMGPVADIKFALAVAVLILLLLACGDGICRGGQNCCCYWA